MEDSDIQTMEEMLSDAWAKNERLQEQIEMLSSGSDLARTIERYEHLSRHAEALGIRAREAERKNAYLRKFAVICFELQKILGVDIGNVLDEVKRLKGV